MTNAGAQQMRHTGTLGAGRSTALHAVLAGVMYVSPLLLFVPAAYVSAGLRHGWRGLAGALSGSLLIVIAILAVLGGSSSERIALCARLVAEVGVPSMVAWWLLARRASFGSVLLWSVITAAAGLAVVESGMNLVTGYSPVGAVIEDFRTMTASSIDVYREQGWQPSVLRTMESSADTVATRFIPTLLVAVQAIAVILSLGMLVRLPVGAALGVEYRFRMLALPEWSPALFAVSALLALAPEPFSTGGWAALVVIALLFTMQGAAVCRWYVARLGLGALATALVFGLLIFLAINGVGLMVLFLLGLFDPFFDFRNLNRKEVIDESHPD